MIDIYTLIEKRKSTRKFQDKEISKDLIKKIISYAYKIPSAGGLYPIELFYVKFDNNITYIVICADFEKTTIKYGKRGVKYVYMEAGHTAQNICLICEEIGLGSCCIGAFDEKEVQARFNLEFKPIYIVAIGYPCE